MTELAVAAHQVGKRYRVLEAPPEGDLNSRPVFRDFWALKDVSFEISQGEIVGLLGSNGAGKTTLLKILSRVTNPTEGFVEVRGTVGSLLQVGAGFNKELTGRENVFLSGSILGIDAKVIARKFSEIVDFSEIKEFIDLPVKHYSSGMAARLAFSVASHLHTDILILDEVLSVGDVFFQRKCRDMMHSLILDGRTVLVVSHNLSTLPQICSRALLLERGRLVHVGTIESTIDRYFENSADATVTFDELDDPRVERQQFRGQATLQPLQAQLAGQRGRLSLWFYQDETVTVRLKYRCLTTTVNFRCVLCFYSLQGEPVLLSAHPQDPLKGYSQEVGDYLLECEVPANLLRPRRYTLSFILIHRAVERVVLHHIFEINVQSRGLDQNPLPEAWIHHPLVWAAPETVS